MKNKHGLFGNPDQTCRRQARIPILIATLIVAVGLSITGCPDSTPPPVIPVVESVVIATDPAGTTTVTRGDAPLRFTAEVLPAGAPQAVTWNVTPANAGSFNDANEFTVSSAVAHNETVIVTATAAGTGVTSPPITLTVNVIPTGVAIATYPVNTATVTRGVPLQFTVNVQPTGAPQAVTWDVYPPSAGSFNDANQFTVSDTLVHGTQVTVTATVTGTSHESNPIELTVNVGITGVNIATYPVDTTTVTRGVPLQFTAEVLPSGVSQEVTWDVYPPTAGSFNDANQFTVSDTLVHGTQVTVMATATGTSHESNSIELTVNVVPTGVTVATYPANTTTVTRGVPLQFTVNVLPAGAPQAVTWGVYPDNAGSFTDNAFTVSGELAHGTQVTITATAAGTALESNPIHLTVHVEPGLDISIDWANFYGLAPDAEDIDIGSISILTGGNITLSNVPDGVGDDDIRWYFGGAQIGTGATLELRSEHLGTLLGPRSVTLVVIVNGSPYSRHVAFTVTM